MQSPRTSEPGTSVCAHLEESAHAYLSLNQCTSATASTISCSGMNGTRSFNACILNIKLESVTDSEQVRKGIPCN